MRQRLVENFSRAWGERAVWKRLPMRERKVLLEGEDRVVYGGYRVPIWRLDEKNFNGRIYSRKLAESVCKSPKVTVALADHPPEEEDASVLNIVGVGKNPFIENGILKVEAYIIDEAFQKKVDRLVELGSGIGLSSTSFGDVDADGNVLMEGFEVERYFDFVVAPSYEVYLDRDAEIVARKEPQLEEVRPSGKGEGVTMEKDRLTEQMEKVFRANLAVNVGSMLEDAERTAGLKERKAKLAKAEEFVTVLGNAEIQQRFDKLTKELSEQTEKLLEKGIVHDTVVEKTLRDSQVKIRSLEERLHNREGVTQRDKRLSEREVDGLQKSVRSLTEKYAASMSLLDRLKEHILKLRELSVLKEAEGNAKVSAKDYSELTRYVEKLERENKALKRKASAKPKVKPSADVSQEAVEASGEDLGYGFGRDEFGLDIWNENEVRAYYEDLLEENAGYRVLKDRILRCKTVHEATMVVLRNKDLVEDAVATSSEIARSSRPSAFAESRHGYGSLDVAAIRKAGQL